MINFETPPPNQERSSMEDYIDAVESLEAASDFRSEEMDPDLEQELRGYEGVEEGMSGEEEEMSNEGIVIEEVEPVVEKEIKWENLDELSERITKHLLDQLLQYGEEKFSPELIGILKEKLIPLISQKIKDNSELLSQGLPEKIGDNLDDLITKIKAELPTEYKQLIEEGDLKKEGDRSKLVKFSSLALDVVPFVGSAKMLTESMRGKTLSGEELSGWKRAIHGLEGGAFLALDLVGVGAVAKAVSPSAKLFTRGAAYMRKMGVSREAYQVVYSTGKFIATHPALAKFLDKKVTHLIGLRSAKMVKAVKEAVA